MSDEEKGSHSRQLAESPGIINENLARQPNSVSPTEALAMGVIEDSNGGLSDIPDVALARRSTKASFIPGPAPDGGVAAITMCKGSCVTH